MAKQLKLRNFNVPRKAKTPPAFDVVWPALKESVDAIHEHKPTAHTLQSLRRQADELCQNFREKTHASLKEVLQGHIEKRRDAMSRLASTTDEVLLETVAQRWTDFLNFMALVRGIFVHLDRDQPTSLSQFEPLTDMSLRLYRQTLFRGASLQTRITDAFLRVVDKDRAGTMVPCEALQKVERMFERLGIYNECLEAPLLERAARFYTEEANTMAEASKLPAYVAHINKRLSEEDMRCSRYLSTATAPALSKLVLDAFIRQQLTFILGAELKEALDEEDTATLRAVVSLLTRTDFTTKLKDAVEKYVQADGLKIVMDEEHDDEMVDRLISLKQRLDRILRTGFLGHAVFKNCVKTAFSNFINKRSNKPAERIAVYLDHFLRKGLKGKPEEEVEEVFNQVLGLFRFVDGKDMFEAFYQDCLSRRLLHQKSASNEHEKLLVSKLKSECGANFTSHLEGMLKDVEISAELNTEFKQHLRATQTSAPLELYVNVLTTSNWPSYPKVNVVLPPQVVRMQELFSKFYCNKHKNRKLLWQPSQGQSILAASFDRGNKELIVSLYQATVLLKFNEHRMLTCQELHAQTGIDMPSLKRTLQSLALGKTRVLAKSPKSKEVDDTDKFIVNYKFSNERRRVKINQIQMKQTREETDATAEKVFQDRVFAIDAAVVRVMKARKTMKHNLLMAELFQQLKFPCKPVDIKKRIESLIERDYLERDPNDPQSYKYLA